MEIENKFNKSEKELKQKDDKIHSLQAHMEGLRADAEQAHIDIQQWEAELTKAEEAYRLEYIEKAEKYGETVSKMKASYSKIMQKLTEQVSKDKEDKIEKALNNNQEEQMIKRLEQTSQDTKTFYEKALSQMKQNLVDTQSEMIKLEAMNNELTTKVTNANQAMNLILK